MKEKTKPAAKTQPKAAKAWHVNTEANRARRIARDKAAKERAKRKREREQRMGMPNWRLAAAVGAAA